MHDDVKTLVEKAKKKGVYGGSCVFDIIISTNNGGYF